MSYTYKRAGKPSPEDIRRAIRVMEEYVREPGVGVSAQAMADFLHSVLNPMTDMTSFMENLMDKLHHEFPKLDRWTLTVERTASIYFYSRSLSQLAEREGEEAEEAYREAEEGLTLAVERAAQRLAGPGYVISLKGGSPGHFHLYVSKR